MKNAIAALEDAIQFYHDALEEDLSAFPYYETHAPSLERHYDMLTIIVDSNPEAHTAFVSENAPFKLHPDRAESAAYEYDKKLSAWKTILGKAWREYPPLSILPKNTRISMQTP